MNFDLWLKKYFLGVVLAFVALAAYFQAAGATQLIGTALSGPATGAPPSRGHGRCSIDARAPDCRRDVFRDFEAEETLIALQIPSRRSQPWRVWSRFHVALPRHQRRTREGASLRHRACSVRRTAAPMSK